MAAIIIMVEAGACRRAGGGETEAVAEIADTSTPLDEETPEPPVAEKPDYMRFATAAEAVGYMKESGHWEQYSNGILPQMAEDELDYATRLLNNSHDGFVVVDKARMKVLKFNKYGEEVVAYGMACARNYGTKHKKADNRTPEGFFSVRKVHDSTDWHFVDDNGVKSEKKGEFGPRFIRLNIPGIYSIGIHGTCAPWSIGGRRSHGCIRVTNENIMKLIEMVDSGMPVIVTPGRKDMMVNLEEDHEVPAISTIPGKKAPSLSESQRKAAIAARDKTEDEPQDTLAADTVAAPKTIEKGDTTSAAKEELRRDSI